MAARPALPFDQFLKTFAWQVRYEWDFEHPLYCLVLGAGASRSAGIPLASGMVEALEKLAARRGIRVDKRKKGDLSWYFRLVFGSLKAKKPGAPASGREFLLACIHRAHKEANIAHLVAAHLATAGIFNPIVTTNFDDLALSAFWGLPWTTADDEPHVIYDPEPAIRVPARIAERVPIILKAHGHHTTYGMGILNQQVARAAPRVHRLLERLPQPTHGYVVLGYSGGWDDGVMRALADPSLTKGRTIYWLHFEKPAEGAAIKRMCAHSHVEFVPITDADLAMLHLWWAIPDDDGDGENPSSAFSIGKHLLLEHFLSFPPGWRSDGRTWPQYGYQWFNPNLVTEGGVMRSADPARLAELRAQLLPILERMHQLDEASMLPDCTGRAMPPEHEEALEAEGKKLASLVPVAIRWTRRNRAFLRLALEEATGLQLGTMLLAELCALSASQKPEAANPVGEKA